MNPAARTTSPEATVSRRAPVDRRDLGGTKLDATFGGLLVVPRFLPLASLASLLRVVLLHRLFVESNERVKETKNGSLPLPNVLSLGESHRRTVSPTKNGSSSHWIVPLRTIVVHET
jgi:hypothetical protein